MTVGGRAVRLSLHGATLALLQNLLLFPGKRSRRERLADRFWRRSSADRQRSALNSAVWRIRAQLKRVPGLDLATEGEALGIDLAPEVVVDTIELAQVMAAATEGELTDELSARLAVALEACEEPLLGGAVPDWALAERERLFHLRLRGLTLLMHWYGDQRRYEDALEVGRRLLVADPLREAAQREVMWLYVLNGQRARALQQYRDFVGLLESELGIAPTPETAALHEHIQRDLDCGRRLTAGALAAVAAGRADKNSPLDLVLGAIERSRLDLYQTLRQLQH